MKKYFLIAGIVFITWFVFGHFFGYPSPLLRDYTRCPTDTVSNIAPNCYPPLTTWGYTEVAIETLILLVAIGFLIAGIVSLFRRSKSAAPKPPKSPGAKD